MPYDPVAEFDVAESHASYIKSLIGLYDNEPIWANLLYTGSTAALGLDNANIATNHYNGIVLVPKNTYDRAFTSGRLYCRVSGTQATSAGQNNYLGFFFMLSNLNPFAAGVDGYFAGYLNDATLFTGGNNGGLVIAKFTNGLNQRQALTVLYNSQASFDPGYYDVTSLAVEWFYDPTVYDAVIIRLWAATHASTPTTYASLIGGTPKFTIIDRTSPLTTTVGEGWGHYLDKDTDVAVENLPVMFDNFESYELT